MTVHSGTHLRRASELALDLVRKAEAAKSTTRERVAAFTESFYETLLDWWSRPRLRWDKTHFPNGTSVESVSIVMVLLYLCRGQVNDCLVEAANFGRDADSIANFMHSQVSRNQQQTGFLHAQSLYIGYRRHPHCSSEHRMKPGLG